MIGEVDVNENNGGLVANDDNCSGDSASLLSSSLKSAIFLYCIWPPGQQHCNYKLIASRKKCPHFQD